MTRVKSTGSKKINLNSINNSNKTNRNKRFKRKHHIKKINEKVKSIRKNYFAHPIKSKNLNEPKNKKFSISRNFLNINANFANFDQTTKKNGYNTFSCEYKLDNKENESNGVNASGFEEDDEMNMEIDNDYDDYNSDDNSFFRKSPTKGITGTFSN
ncbi:uncharacterized protein ASCRUDRAFT_134340 [Ascoidea rubescens DSM 1968]|uniref:Uncharacterized protein n=1 Tax=Ascoidea rubescens DSM 1968 TaxID=1344418 RepID=A0A1D2VL75_9ASCO|nr:hypothetical protein ASCRUDRAFT_134340 [Ascoidea rubescens DSM 1968]ODV62349.1 hypothetical protein ASCRUDRAFT_134340 [Ascoidea rubescens DSM 1968]